MALTFQSQRTTLTIRIINVIRMELIGARQFNAAIFHTFAPKIFVQKWLISSPNKLIGEIIAFLDML